MVMNAIIGWIEIRHRHHQPLCLLRGNAFHALCQYEPSYYTRALQLPGRPFKSPFVSLDTTNAYGQHSRGNSYELFIVHAHSLQDAVSTVPEAAPLDPVRLRQ